MSSPYTAVGLDVGNTSSHLAVPKPFDLVDVLADSQGHRSIPSLVAFQTEQVLIGEAAQMQQHLNPQTFDNLRNKLASTEIIKINDKSLTSEQLLTEFLNKLSQSTNTHSTQKLSCVSAVPTHFTEQQINSFQSAINSSTSLCVIRLIKEPIAICMAYNFDTPRPSSQNLIVIDIGGSSTQVSVVHASHDGFLTLLASSNRQLGGKWIDDKLIDHFAKEFQRSYNLDLHKSTRGLSRLRIACEHAKKVLSASNCGAIECEALYEGCDLYSSIKRSRFDSILGPLLAELSKCIESALKVADLSIADIDSVLLAGGSCKLPKIQDFVCKFFNRSVLESRYQLDELVAVGCAIQASLLHMHADSEDIKKEM